MKLWIARDKNGTLWIYKNKPQLDINYWYDVSGGTNGCIAKLSENSFPEITFENSPRQVKIELI